MYGRMRRTVLIVDDTQHYASTLEIAMQQASDLDVVHALSGRDAIAYLQGQSGKDVCAVVTDLQMPVMDGFELIKWIRSNGNLRSLPIVVVSGTTDPSVKDRSRMLGADAFFAKPCSPAEVRIKVQELVRQREGKGADG